MTAAADVVAGRATWSVEQADALAFLAALPEGSIDLVFGSPPYEDRRTYGIGFALKGQDWVDWMVRVCDAAARVCRGLVAFVIQGKTEDFRWSASPVLLMADLHRRGFNLRNPPIFRRVGIPGSGEPDWLRSDYEWVLCVTRPGQLPWSDNTACGHPPRWAPGGAMSHRLSSGQRVNQWGATGERSGGRVRRANGERPAPGSPSGQEFVSRKDLSPPPELDLFGEPVPEAIPAKTALGFSLLPDGTVIGNGNRRASGKRRGNYKPRQADGTREEQGDGYATPEERNNVGPHRARRQAGSTYGPPVLANPGNVVQQTYTAQEVAALLGEPADVIDTAVGGGRMGSPLAHDNEAPFPEALAGFFVRTFCPPGGIVLDPFAGSGTSLAVATRWGRRAVGCDLRESQVALARRRVEGVTPTMFPEG